MLNINEVGAQLSESATGNLEVKFGVYLPNITSNDGYQVIVRIIHKQDQFIPGVPPKNFLLTHQVGHPLDLWTTVVDLQANTDGVTHFGKSGTYYYRYQLKRNNKIVVDWFTDPFARASGPGELAAFTTIDRNPTFTWTDNGFSVPNLDDIILYELQVEEFADNFEAVIDKLDYLTALGINALELMPVTSVKQEFNWGYGPLHFFAPEERFGGELGLKKLVNACHKKGFAVILDSVYEHIDTSFAYERVYSKVQQENPMIGAFLEGGFGPEIDFNKEFARNYFQAVNEYWLTEYHVDGFRYDYVPGYYDGPTGNGYAQLVFQTYQKSLNIARFQHPSGYSKIIQIAEDLDHPQDIMRETYTCATWQNGLLDKAVDMAQKNYVDDSFVHLLDPLFIGYPNTKNMNGKDIPVAPLQYIETHDHSRFISYFGKEDNKFGDRSKFYMLQPFAIALYTCQGIPMLWQGQEFAENYIIPDDGPARISFRRSVHWKFFYDNEGQTLISLYRKLGNLRRTISALRSRKTFYYNNHSKPADGLIVYQRTANDESQLAIVFINFSPIEQRLWLPFPQKGSYREKLDDGSTQPQISVQEDEELHEIIIPSHYGRILVKD